MVPPGQPEDIKRRRAPLGPGVNLEEVDFLRTTTVRQAIHAREAGRCFYCLKRHTPSSRCIDHVVPRAHSGRNSYRNLVSSCLECNSRKGPCRADDFLRSLFRDRKLTDRELAGRLRALDALAAGKLPPPLAAVVKPAADWKIEIVKQQEKVPPLAKNKPRKDGAPRDVFRN